VVILLNYPTNLRALVSNLTKFSSKSLTGALFLSTATVVLGQCLPSGSSSSLAIGPSASRQIVNANSPGYGKAPTMTDVSTGGSDGALWAYYGQQKMANEIAILVAPQGLSNGWGNSGSQDITFVDQMREAIENDLCVTGSLSTMAVLRLVPKSLLLEARCTSRLNILEAKLATPLHGLLLTVVMLLPR